MPDRRLVPPFTGPGRARGRSGMTTLWHSWVRAALRSSEDAGPLGPASLQGDRRDEPHRAGRRCLDLLEGACAAGHRQPGTRAAQAHRRPITRLLRQTRRRRIWAGRSFPPARHPLSAPGPAPGSAPSSLDRALAMISLGLRSGACAEWNFSLRGRATTDCCAAAAQPPCDKRSGTAVVNTSEHPPSRHGAAPRPSARMLAAARGSGSIRPMSTA